MNIHSMVDDYLQSYEIHTFSIEVTILLLQLLFVCFLFFSFTGFGLRSCKRRRPTSRFGEVSCKMDST